MEYLNAQMSQCHLNGIKPHSSSTRDLENIVFQNVVTPSSVPTGLQTSPVVGSGGSGITVSMYGATPAPTGGMDNNHNSLMEPFNLNELLYGKTVNGSGGNARENLENSDELLFSTQSEHLQSVPHPQQRSPVLPVEEGTFVSDITSEEKHLANATATTGAKRLTAAQFRERRQQQQHNNTKYNSTTSILKHQFALEDEDTFQLQDSGIDLRDFVSMSAGQEDDSFKGNYSRNADYVTDTIAKDVQDMDIGVMDYYAK